ncbi:uncharacterized protein LOC106460009 [Limulus polyphemus]|uniref:Uncharacterized protein LOC106460009 n=1 Tax=Limulus polyphemus TaxID=6850 RepID=A0ABM1SFB4_LIMPO|nr:uncharacterized protein LOC106460009 [Limulus polyphemus]
MEIKNTGSSLPSQALNGETSTWIPAEITAETLEKYLNIEKEIQSYEKRHVLENYQVKTEQLEQLEKKVEELEETQKQLEEQAMKLQAVVDADGASDQNVKEFLIEKTENGQELTKEQEDFVDALNRQEIIKRELESTNQQRDSLKEEVAILTEDGEKVQKFYEERDELLDSIFGGDYGSDLENRLEKEVDLLKEQKNHMNQAHFKWRQGHMMIKQAAIQLGLGVQKWKEIPEIPTDELEKRYYCAAEARNNLVAASQNLQGAHRYLPNVIFPYCAHEEVETLNKAITYIFTDMQTTERHEHAMSCYHVIYRRSGALRQWFEQVLNTTIAQDLSRLTEECKLKSLELRRERIRLIGERIKAMTGKDIDFVLDIENEGDDAATDGQVTQLFEAEKVEGEGSTLAPGLQMPPAPTPVPLTDLAPPPSNEEIFGKIDELKKRHETQVQDFQKSQAMNHARMEVGLKEKLNARRNRRNRLQMHSEELQALETAA